MFANEEKKEIGMRFSEKMSGYLAEGEQAFEEGERIGRSQNNTLSFDVTIEIDSVDDFVKLSDHEAVLEGTVSHKPLGQKLPIRNGEFNLFQPDRVTGKRHMTYSFGFTGNDADYFLYGYKVIYDDPHEIDLFDDMTTLFTRIYKGDSVDGTPLGSGILHFRLQSLPSMLASFDVTNTRSFIKKFKTIKQFYDFCYGELRDTYLDTLSPIYYTEYENLVLNGKIVSSGENPQNFFFFSGIHDKDFPWGDDEVFWDIALIVQQSDNSWARYVLTDRIIEDLELDVEDGMYRYEGPIYQLLEGYQVSRSELFKSPLPEHLRKIDAKIEIRFRPQEYPTVDLPFPLISNFKRLIPREYLDDVREWFSHLDALGLHLTPHKIRVSSGKITLKDESTTEEYSILTDGTMGEAEKSTFQNIREPKLYYNYFCGLNPESDHIYVKVRSDVLRENRKDYLVDKVEGQLGKIINHIVSLDLDIREDDWRVLPKDEAKSFKMVDEDLLEINNDHFPTAVFQRRIVAMTDAAGELFYALEEDMDILNLSSINSDKVVTVAAIKDDDKFNALDEVLEVTDFFGKLDSACEQSGKSKDDFAIIVKPNFMFMYSTKDPSTYTDPYLVEHLIDGMYQHGYCNLAVAEARSSYGIFFHNREVKTVAEYIGLTGKNYRIIDLSEDHEEYQYSGKLGKHYVNREWKNADFRIAFAKSKTHSYAYYTLTIKDIYGALPMENKFLEYHHERDIYTTTIEYLKHFPIRFALIDAHISADGPFGIFADKNPNYTETIIGGEEIVAVDWIGSAKMGLDPMVSDYMKYAVEAFGKPKIKMVGDRAIYPDWVNVPDVVSTFAFGLDKDYYFGNLFYSVFSYMDDFFEYKDPSLARRFLRLLTDPLKSLFFQRIEQGALDAELNRKLYELFTERT